jgi:hypothetical protein
MMFCRLTFYVKVNLFVWPTPTSGAAVMPPVAGNGRLLCLILTLFYFLRVLAALRLLH